MGLIHRRAITLLMILLLFTFSLPVIAEDSIVEENIPTSVVGQSIKLPLQFQDDRGNCVALGEGYKDITIDSYVIEKPEGAKVDVDEEVGSATNIKNKGCTNIKISSDKVGLVKVQMVITVKDYKDSNIVYMSQLVAKFVPKINEELGTKVITMFIGEKSYVQDGEAKVSPLVPFIDGGHIYVPVRILAEGFGTGIDWDSDSKIITLKREDMTIEIKNESKQITKKADGITTIIEAETTPFIKEGFTVVPYKALGEVFGYKVTYDEHSKAISYTR